MIIFQLVRWYSESDMNCEIGEKDSLLQDNGPVTPESISSIKQQKQHFQSYHTPARMHVSVAQRVLLRRENIFHVGFCIGIPFDITVF